MRLPSTIRVGGRDYKVTLVTPPLDPEKRDVLGRTRNASGEFLIDSSLHEQEMGTTLWHEIIHAISYRYFYNSMFPDDKSEEYTDRFGEALAQVMRDLGIVFEFEKEEYDH